MATEDPQPNGNGTATTEPAPAVPDYLASPNAVFKDEGVQWRYGRAPDYSKTRKVWEEGEFESPKLPQVMSGFGQHSRPDCVAHERTAHRVLRHSTLSAWSSGADQRLLDEADTVTLTMVTHSNDPGDAIRRAKSERHDSCFTGRRTAC